MPILRQVKALPTEASSEAAQMSHTKEVKERFSSLKADEHRKQNKCIAYRQNKGSTGVFFLKKQSLKEQNQQNYYFANTHGLIFAI